MADIKIYDRDNLPKYVEIPKQHASENDFPEGEYEENEYNYRLNTAATIYYAVNNKKVIGHLGLSSDDEVLAVYVDPSFRGKGTALSLYKFAVKDLGELWSDPMAQDAGGKAIWESLKKLDSENVELGKKKFIYKKGSPMPNALVAKIVQKVKANLKKTSGQLDKSEYKDALDILGTYPSGMKNINSIYYGPQGLKIESDISSLGAEDFKHYNIRHLDKDKSGNIQLLFKLNATQIVGIEELLEKNNHQTI